MGLLFRKIPKRLIKVDVENYGDFSEPLDDLSSLKLTDINCFIMRQPSSRELILVLEDDSTTDEQIYQVFSNLKMKAKIVERKMGIQYQYGFPKFLAFTHTKGW